VPVNDVQRVMGHENASTALDHNTHSSAGWIELVRGTFADFRATDDSAGDGE